MKLLLGERMTYEVLVNGRPHTVELERHGQKWRCRVDGNELEIDIDLSTGQELSLLVAGRSYAVKTDASGAMWIAGERYATELRDPRSFRARKQLIADKEGAQAITALMPGKIVRVLVSEGERVQAGQRVLVVEAMKMQNELKATTAGVVRRLTASAGASVEAGQVLALIEG